MYTIENVSELKTERWKYITIFGEEMTAEVRMEDVTIILRRINNKGWMRPKSIIIRNNEKKYPEWVFNYILKRVVRIYMQHGAYERVGRLLLWMDGKNNDFVIEFMDMDEFYDSYMRGAMRHSNIFKFTDYDRRYKFAIIKDMKDSQDVVIIKFRLVLAIEDI